MNINEKQNLNGASNLIKSQESLDNVVLTLPKGIVLDGVDRIATIFHIL